jgi:plastocyanin
VILAACGGSAESGAPAYIVVRGDTIPLANGARVTEVTVRSGREPEFEPDRVLARPGDVVRIASLDGGPHAIAFDLAATDPASLAYLERTAQLRGPPLLSSGATWILRFDEASASGYVIRCLTHGATLAVSVESQLAGPQGRQ